MNRGNQIGAKLDMITIHASPMKEENVETHLMTRRSKFVHHQSQPHDPLEGSTVVNTCYAHINNFLFFFLFLTFMYQKQHHPRDQIVIAKIPN
jgi:hypothetical protein